MVLHMCSADGPTGALNEGRSLSCSTPGFLLFPASFKMQKASCCMPSMPSTSSRYLDNDSSLISVLL